MDALAVRIERRKVSWIFDAAAQGAGIALREQHPLGIGPGQFDVIEQESTHNLYVRVFAEQGPLGLLVLPRWCSGRSGSPPATLCTAATPTVGRRGALTRTPSSTIPARADPEAVEQLSGLGELVDARAAGEGGVSEQNLAAQRDPA